MADDIGDIATRWQNATAEMMADAIRDWDRQTDCPGVVLSDDVAELARLLVRWCDDSGQPMDPTPITDCIRFARMAESSARVERADEAQSAFDKFGDAWSECVPLLDRIRRAATQQAQLEKFFPSGRDGISQDTIDIAWDIIDSDTDTPQTRRALARKHFADLPGCNARASRALQDLRARESKGRIVIPPKRNKRNGAPQFN